MLGIVSSWKMGRKMYSENPPAAFQYSPLSMRSTENLLSCAKRISWVLGLN